MKLETLYNEAISNGGKIKLLPNVELGERQKIRFAIKLAKVSTSLSEVENFISNSSDDLI